jgi:hypothetical protein
VTDTLQSIRRLIGLNWRGGRLTKRGDGLVGTTTP